MHRVAVLVDVGFVSQSFKKIGAPYNADSVYNFAKAFVKTANHEEELMRIFFYHAEPLAKKDAKLPISKNLYDFSATSIYQSNMNFLKELALKDNVAIRRGKTVFRGWQLKDPLVNRLKKGSYSGPLTDKDFSPIIQQKGVDIKIGLDVAWISEHNDISKIILITSDSDFVPAMKFARREGVQIIVGHCDALSPKYEPSFREHTDTVRKVTRVANTTDWHIV